MNALLKSGGAAAVITLAGVLFAGEPAPVTTPAPPLPRLVELGSATCIPCRRMKPIIEELTREQAGVMGVVFIDVKKDPDRAAPYRVRIIPCQVFLDAAGKERFRHTGFWSKQDILNKWRELGVTPRAAAPAPTTDRK